MVTNARWLVGSFAALSSVASCTAILGANKDYHEVSTGGAGAGSSAHSSGSGGASASSTSSTSSTGTTSSSSGVGGTGGVGTGGSQVTVASASASSSSGVTMTCQQLDYACMADPPAGWSFVAFQASSQPACPLGFGSATTVEEAPPVGGSCPCTCGAPLTNPCEGNQGMTQIQFGANNCNNGIPQFIGTTDGLCDTFNIKLAQSYLAGEVRPPNPQQVTCGFTATLPPLDPVVGRTCSLGAAAPGCTTGETCVPPTASGELCIQSAGNVACPALESTKYVVYLPADVTDERVCDGTNSCNCRTMANTCSGTLTTYTNAACNGNGSATVNANQSCDVVTGSTLGASNFILSLTPNTTLCNGSGQAPIQGKVVTTNPITICCL